MHDLDMNVSEKEGIDSAVCVFQLPLFLLEDQILPDGSLEWNKAYGCLEAGLKPHRNSGIQETTDA